MIKIEIHILRSSTHRKYNKKMDRRRRSSRVFDILFDHLARFGNFKFDFMSPICGDDRFQKDHQEKMKKMEKVTSYFL